MKLLLDQNLSYRLVGILAGSFPGTTHVRNEGLAEASDSEVWRHAANNDFVIVSKDSDFQQMALIRGAPPKVIRLRIGNCTTDQIIVARSLGGNCEFRSGCGRGLSGVVLKPCSA